MAIYHCSIKIVKRGMGKSAVAAAAYRAGEKMANEYDGMVHDYTRKSGVVHSEILLPSHAPGSFSDRATLWNAVEKIEKHRRAQLAREIEIALPNELDRTAQIQLVREYVQHTFVNAGMCADFSIHDPKGEQQNVHAHILLTMRPLDENGVWADKQRKEYVLDAAGNKIYDPKKKQYRCNTIAATDWNERTKAEEWRAAWADFANRALAQGGIHEAIDHRSYARQGIEQIPTVHLGVAASQMERRGLATERGDLNRMIHRDNQLIRTLKKKIAALEKWLQGAVAGLKESPKPQTLASLLAENTSTEQAAQAIAFLEAERIDTWEQLEEHIGGMRDQTFDLTRAIKQFEGKMKDLKMLLDASETYLATKPVHQQYAAITHTGQRKKFYDDHTADLVRYDAARKTLDASLPDKKLHINQWKTEYNTLANTRAAEYAKLKSLRQRVTQVEGVRKQADMARRLSDPAHRDDRDKGIAL